MKQIRKEFRAYIREMSPDELKEAIAQIQNGEKTLDNLEALRGDILILENEVGKRVFKILMYKSGNPSEELVFTPTYLSAHRIKTQSSHSSYQA